MSGVNDPFEVDLTTKELRSTERQDWANFSDEALVRLAQRGAPEAFSALCERYLPRVLRRLRAVLPPEEVEDVAQEVFAAMIRSLQSFRHEAQFSTWLRTLVNRQVANFYRRRQPAQVPLDLAGFDDPTEAGQESLPQEFDLRLSYSMDQTGLDEQIWLRQALLHLPENYREVLFLRFTEGLTFEEIARLQGRSLEATKSLFRRAVAALQRGLADER